MNEVTDFPTDLADVAADGRTFDLDTSSTKREDIGSKRTIDKMGKYHVEISRVVPKTEPFDSNGNPRSASLLYEVRALKSVEGLAPEGSVAYFEIWLTGKEGGPPQQSTIDAHIDWLFAAGVLAEKEIEGETFFVHPETGKPQLGNIVELAQKYASGAQLIVQIVPSRSRNENYNGQPVINPWSGKKWRLDDPAMSDIPVNEEAKAMWNPPAGKKGSTVEAKAEKTAEPAAKKEAEESGDDDFDI